MTNTNYNKMSRKNKEAVELIEPKPTIQQPVDVEETSEPKTVEGIVSGCDRLNVRAEASVDSESLGTIKRDTALIIYESESIEDFYSVCTESGLTGFCMKKFISIR